MTAENPTTSFENLPLMHEYQWIPSNPRDEDDQLRVDSVEFVLQGGTASDQPSEKEEVRGHQERMEELIEDIAFELGL